MSVMMGPAMTGLLVAACCSLLTPTDTWASQLGPQQPKTRMVTKGLPKNYLEIMAQDKERIKHMIEDRASKMDKLGTITRRPHSRYLSTYQGVTKNVPFSSDTFTSAYQKAFNDPEWPHQWYVQDYRVDDSPVFSLNVMPLYWDGITGREVTVAVVDSGFDSSNEDIAPNYRPDLSYDVCTMKSGAGINPARKSAHGTHSAGVIAMAANNSFCGVGIAFGSSIAGINYVCTGASSDYTLSRTAVHKLQSFDIFSNSWGPLDDGQYMSSVTPLYDKALQKGITEGRGGKGAIYVWAAGNGGNLGDNCAADEIVNHIASIAIACASQRGQIMGYSEPCSAIYGTTYSANDNAMDEMIVAASINTAGCITWYSGTSAATPLAAGIFALLLHANRKLTHRDIKHLVVLGSEVAPLADNGDIWYRNAMGFWVSQWFGFGLLNAENMYLLAKQWHPLPDKHTCQLSFLSNLPQEVTFMKTTVVEFVVGACKGTESEILYLEQLELSASVKYPYRGGLHLALVSPSGTRTTILAPRPRDKNTDGLHLNNSFKSLHTWGEDPRGTWKLEITPKMRPGGWRLAFGWSGTVEEIRMTLHGTKEKPFYYEKLVPPPRKYWGFRLPDGRTSEDPFPPIPDRH